MEKNILRSRSYRDLEVWKLGRQFAKDIYFLTNQFPQSELYGLIQQIRRAAVSIPSNIAEGQARNSIKEFIQFLAISLGSMAELETQLIIAREIGYSTEEDIYSYLTTLDRIRKMVKGLSIKLKQSCTEN